jgi:hypothetical protein
LGVGIDKPKVDGIADGPLGKHREFPVAARASTSAERFEKDEPWSLGDRREFNELTAIWALDGYHDPTTFGAGRRILDGNGRCFTEYRSLTAPPEGKSL